MISYAEWFIKTYEIRAVYPFDATRVLPVDAGEGRLSEVTLFTPDGESLILWVAAPADAAAMIFYLPGNAGNLATRTARFSYILDQGYGLIALAYRGSSGSSGVPDEAALTRDALQIFDSLADFVPQLDGPVILYGESLGTGIAAKIAARRQADGVILEAPFTSFVDLGKIQYPSLDLGRILTQIWDTTAVIADVEEPLLVLHGVDDKLVPVEQGQAVFDMAGSADKRIVKLGGIGHTGLWTAEGIDAIFDFLQPIRRVPQ